MTIEAWGDCFPGLREWGTVPLEVLTDNYRSPVPEIGIARWAHGFSKTFVIVRRDVSTLRVQAFELFFDDSGRCNYAWEQNLKRPKKSKSQPFAGFPSP